MGLMNWYGRFPQGTKDKVAMNLVDRESRDLWKRRAWRLLHNAKRWRRKFRDETKAQKWFLERNYELTREWEAERDRYQEAVKLRDNIAQDWIAVVKQRDEARAGHSKEIRRVVELEEFYYQACKQRDEAVERLLYFKGLYEQGAPMTIAGMNKRIAELEKKSDTLTGRLGLNRLAIEARNARIRELRKALVKLRLKAFDVTCIYCCDRQGVAYQALLKDDNEQTKN